MVRNTAALVVVLLQNDFLACLYIIPISKHPPPEQQRLYSARFLMSVQHVGKATGAAHGFHNHRKMEGPTLDRPY